MGYYTNYNLDVYADKDNGLEIIKKMYDELESDKFYPFEYALENLLKSESNNSFELEGSDACKLYEHKEEMKELSELFPNTLFKLHGEGEENGDIWDKYFLNGKVQECNAKIVIEPYDKNKLK